jgi:hypothetical protein
MDERDVISGGSELRTPFKLPAWTRSPKFLRWAAGMLAAVSIIIGVLTLGLGGSTNPHPSHTPEAGQPRSIESASGSQQPVTLGCLAAYGANRLVVSIGLVPHLEQVRLVDLSVRGVGMRLLSSAVVSNCTNAEHPAPVQGALLTPGTPKALFLTFAVTDCGILPHLANIDIILRSGEADHFRVSRLSAKLGATPPNVILACEIAMNRQIHAASRRAHAMR